MAASRVLLSSRHSRGLLARRDMAATRPKQKERMGPLEAFARRFKSRAEREGEVGELSNALGQTSISSRPSKPPPGLPSWGPPSHSPGHRPQQLAHHSANGAAYYHQEALQLNHRLGQPGYLVGSSSQYLPHMPLPQSVSIDHITQPKLPNPWELAASVPPSSLPPSLLSPTHPTRPVSAPTLCTPTKPAKRGKSIVTDPLQLPGLHQCWGIKRDGLRCTRRVGLHSSSPTKARTASKSPSPRKGRGTTPGSTQADALLVSDSDGDSSGCGSQDDERRQYCHQHSKEINKTSGFILPGLRRVASKGKKRATGGGDGSYIHFDRYLGQGMGQGGIGEENCKARLRTAMCQSPSDVDWMESGYIYIYELRDRSTATHIALKVGRAVNVYKRFEQWRSQCQSKSPLLRAFFPRPAGVPQDVLPGSAGAVEEGALLSHKWERLCHIELSYLGQRLDDKCNDCGSRHREIFLLSRDIGYEGVTKMVEKWLAFVRVVAKDGLGSTAS